MIQYSWKIRRALIFSVTLFSMAVILLALLVRPDASASPHAIKWAFGAITTVLTGYVFGAVWDDKRKK